MLIITRGQQENALAAHAHKLQQCCWQVLFLYACAHPSFGVGECHDHLCSTTPAQEQGMTATAHVLLLQQGSRTGQ